MKNKNAMKNFLTRRGFLQKTLAAGAAVAGLSSFKNSAAYDPKGLPTVAFGRTGIRIPRIGIGLGSRFCAVADENESLSILSYALDNGIYYWDTANSYMDHGNGVVSEERIGKILKHRRKEIFLSTKVASRDAGEAARQFETSLGRLQTDHVDNLMIHDVSTIEDVGRITQKGGVLDLINNLKEKGLTRFIGFSGHAGAEAKKLLIERGNFDNVLFAMNQFGDYSQSREELVLPAANEKGLGILLMKVVRPKETVPGVSAGDLVRFALSLEGPSGLVLGMDSIGVVRSNIELMRNFTPMTSTEKANMAVKLAPFFRGSKLEWSNPGYRDGYWG
jgi:uncharacterized protein